MIAKPLKNGTPSCLSQASLCPPAQALTCDFGLEGAASNVVWATIFNGDEVAARCHGCVDDLVALWALLAVHLHLRGAIDGDGQCPRPSICGVDYELSRASCRGEEQEAAASLQGSGQPPIPPPLPSSRLSYYLSCHLLSQGRRQTPCLGPQLGPAPQHGS